LEAGNLPSAQQRLAATDWKSPATKLLAARAIARALAAAGRAAEGLEIVRSVAGADDVDLGQALWELGGRDEAKDRLRAAALVDRQQHLVDKASTQLNIGDKEGAIETLRRVESYPEKGWSIIRYRLAGALAFAALDEEAL